MELKLLSSRKLLLILCFAFLQFSAFCQVFTDTNLPIVIITTDIDPQTGLPLEIVDDPRVLGNMKIIYRPDGTRNYITDQDTPAYLNYNGRIDIEIRGSSSQSLPKKQYGFTTLQANNTSNNNVSLLGMPKENDWILNGLAFDPSLIRDYLSYNLTRQAGNYASRTQFCEVVINGIYQGLYILQEKLKDDSGRINIEEILTTDNAQPNLSGGYITKADKTTGGDPVAWTMASNVGITEFIHDLPKPEDVTAAQNTYIQGQFQSLASTSLLGNATLANGYPSIIDIPTFVDFMIMNELASNADAYQISTYFHKDRGGKLRAGPVWDMNLTYGNDLFIFGLDRSHTNVWQFSNGDNEGPRFWTNLFNSAQFKCYLSRRWDELTQTGKPLNYNSMVTYIDQVVTLISEAIPREQAKWGTVPNHAVEISAMKDWLLARTNWITNNLGSFSACSNVATPALVINKINYNPGTSGQFPVANDQEFIEIKNTGATTVNLTGVYLRELGVSYQFPASTTLAAGQSAYIASNPAVFQVKHGFAPFGQFMRNMSNSSQKLVLADGFGNTIDQVEYFDSAPWPNADGNGNYLSLINTSLDNNLASSWQAVSAATLSSDGFTNAATVSIYPNPVHHLLTISAPAGKKVDVSDLTGKLLYSAARNEAAVTTIDFSNCAAGIYIIKITTDSGNITSKVVKE